MLAIILILELGSISGGEGFNMQECSRYSGKSAYQLRKILAELKKLGMVRRQANRFYITIKGQAVYEACLIPKPVFSKKEMTENEKIEAPF